MNRSQLAVGVRITARSAFTGIPKGAVIWVKLDESISTMLTQPNKPNGTTHTKSTI